MSASRPHAKRRPPAGARRPSDEGPGARFALLLALLAVLFGLIAVRLVWVQVVQAGELTSKARAQRLRDIQIPPWRGTIYDREGDPLAQSVEAKSIFANPMQVKEKSRTAATLAQVLGGDPKTYLDKLSRKAGFVYIQRKVEMSKARALANLKLEGIGFLEDSRRVYPAGNVGGQILGFVGVDNSGLAGIEAQYNSVLAGKPGVLLAELDRRGEPIPGGVQKSIDPQDGRDVVLTIDKDIQFEVQAKLAAAVKEHAAKAGSVVVMNPKNGEIYAVASYPYLDPNNFAKADPKAMRLMPVTDAYEPGSTIKCLTAASAIDRGRATPKTKFDLPPTLRVAGHTIHEAHSRGTVNWTLTEIVTESSNIGAVRIGQKLGPSALHDCFKEFGLGRDVGVDFPGIAYGWMPPSPWSSLSMANIPFGQGVSATPLQLCRAISGIANRGMLPTPHLLLSLPQDPGEQRSWPTTRAIGTKAASETVAVMKNVVVAGTGKAAKVVGYDVAGKTGTAQVALPNGRGYAKGTYNSSFIGFLPARDPQLLVCVILYQPSNGYYGGQVAAPVFSEIAQFSAAHLHIPPTEVVTVGAGTPSAAKARSTKSAPGQTKPHGGANQQGNSDVNGGVTDDAPNTRKP